MKWKSKSKAWTHFLRKWYLTQLDIDWIKGPSPRLKDQHDFTRIKAQAQGLRLTLISLNESLILHELRPKPKAWDSHDFAWVEAQAQG